MIFPEIASRIKNLLTRMSPPPIRLFEEKSLVSLEAIQAGWYERNGYYGIASILGGGQPAWSGETVSIDTAQTHSVVWTCRRILAESVGFLPLTMMRRAGDVKEPAFDKPMYTALHDAPNDEITAQRFRETLTGHCVLGGNAYAQILRRSGTGIAVELQPLMPAQVEPAREKSGQKRLVYLVKEGNAAEKTYTVQRGVPQDILHIPGIGWDGIRGYSVVRMARQSIGTALATERNVARFYGNGGRLPYNLKLTQKFKDKEAADQFRSDWETIYSDPHRAPILEPWLDYQQTGLSLHDAQMLESRQFGIPEICRWFRISPHLAGDLSRATFSNIEQLALEFVNFTLVTWLKRWEQELWRCVLTPAEKAQGYFFRHNVNAILRGDFQTRMEGYASALQNGHMNVDEVRDLEDRNPLPDGAGADYHIQLNMQALPAEGAPKTTNSLVRLGKSRFNKELLQ